VSTKVRERGLKDFQSDIVRVPWMMTAAYHTSHTMDDGFNDGGSDDSEMEVWDETEVAAVETSIRESARGSSHESVTQWGNAYFRPGTAPEVLPPSLSSFCNPPSILKLTST